MSIASYVHYVFETTALTGINPKQQAHLSS